jgi:probable F420-dependent oxidoreductase
VALNLPNYGPLGNREAMLTIAGAAEALGFESLWTTDHILVPDSLPAGFFANLLETLLTLTFVAARTERIGIGTGVLVLPQREPVLVAKQLATLQHLSGGRLSVAFAVGYLEQEYRFLRAEYHHRGALLDEYLPAVRQLLEAERPQVHTEHIDLEGVYFSPRPNSAIPLFVGGSSVASLVRAARLGDGWYAFEQTAAQIANGLHTIHAYRTRSSFQTSLRVATRIGGLIPGAVPGEAPQGSMADVAHSVLEFSEAGVDRIVVEPVTDDLEEFLVQITRFMRDVVPLLS